MCVELIIAMWYSLRVFTIDNCSNYWQEDGEEERERKER
jgi:hypothetical protein